MRRARLSLLLLLLLACLPAPALGSWAYVPVEELVQESDLVVVGTLRDVAEHTAGGVDYGRGHIVVREVIWGRVAPGDALLLKWSNASDLMCPRVEHRPREGEEGIWLLSAEGGHVEANYPGRFVGLGERREVESALARYPVTLRGGKYFAGPDEPLHFTVVYRNFSGRERTFPGVSFSGGLLHLPPSSRFVVSSERDGGQRRLAAPKVSFAPAPETVTLAPRGEHRVELDLRPLLDAAPSEGEGYKARLTLAGLRPTNEVRFYFNRQLSPPREAGPPPEAPAVDCFYVFEEAAPRGVPPHRRAMLTFVAAFSLYLWFRKLRAR